MYKNLETLLVTTANGKDFEEHFKIVTGFYGTDLTQSRLKAQLDIPATHFQKTDHDSSCLARPVQICFLRPCK